MQSAKKSLKDLAQEKNETNPSQLGDPISLKAETSNTQPTDDDMPNKAARARAVGDEGKDKGGKSNKSQLGDPVSLKAETSKSEPTEDDRGSGRTGSGKPKI